MLIIQLHTVIGDPVETLPRKHPVQYPSQKIPRSREMTSTVLQPNLTELQSH
jgi:hypothetical protein